MVNKKLAALGLIICIVLLIIGMAGVANSLTAKNNAVAKASDSNIEDVYKSIDHVAFGTPNFDATNSVPPLTIAMVIMVFIGAGGTYYIYTYQIKKTSIPRINT